MITQENSVVSVPVYEAGDDGALTEIGHIAPTLFEGANGPVIRFTGPASYYLNDVKAWPGSETVCIYRAMTHYRCLFVKVDDVHHTVATLLERWHGEMSAA